MNGPCWLQQPGSEGVLFPITPVPGSDSRYKGTVSFFQLYMRVEKKVEFRMGFRSHRVEQAGGTVGVDDGGGGSGELLWCVQLDQRREFRLQSSLGACLRSVLSGSQTFK